MTRFRLPTALAFVVGVGLLHAILILPAQPQALTIERILRPTWELPAVLLLLALVQGAWLRGAVVVAAMVLMVLRAGDLGTYVAFSRPFNPLLDLHLLVSGWALLASSIGRSQAIVAIGAVIVGVAVIAAVLWLCLSRMRRAPRVGSLGLAGAAMVLAMTAAAVPGWRPLAATPGIVVQVTRMKTGVADLATFTAALQAAPEEAPDFGALQGRDVIVAFVESYGRSFLEDAEFAKTALPRLAAVEARMNAAGWSQRSGWLAAPTRGGQSWLSHGTLFSGLWVDTQVRYDRLMTSNRVSLNALFGRAGWKTGAAMPAITLDWPEAGWYGYDTTLDAEGLAYRGQPFEWVTMPDQYTWSALDAKLRGETPAMIEVALITSHAPWTPLPDILPWEEIGDGSVFDGTRRDGETPRVVWSNPDTIRAQYAKSLDYALEIMGQYVAGFGDGAFFIVLGDHQPASLLAGQGASPDVPVHVISDDPALLDRLPAELFVPGMLPDPARPTLPMQDLRAILTTIYEEPLADPRE